MKKMLVFGMMMLVLLSACKQSKNDELMKTDDNDSKNNTIIQVSGQEKALMIKKCDGIDTPCLRDNGVPDEYNYCEEDSDCIFSPIASCECSPPDNPGKAINSVELERYNSLKEEDCKDAGNVSCPKYSPPQKHSIYESLCLNNICRTVRTGWR